MDKRKFKELIDNPELIPGIHNYCDRWCERCPLTRRCAVFAMEQAESADSSSCDPDNEAFWQRLRGILKTTMELLTEMAQEAGVDIDTLDSEEEAQEARIGQKAGEHGLVRASMEYMKMVGAWFESSDGLAGETAKEADLKEIEQVILWHHSLICAKIRRAVQQEPGDRPACSDDMPNDSDGSAKVALIAVDRSMAAWWRMRGHFPRRKDEIIKFLVHLDRIRRELERTFPKARAFVRPGFDE